MHTENDSVKSNVGLYVRVSTMNQIDRDSLQTQEDRLKAYCIVNGMTNYKIFKDAGFSAKDTNRPALEDLVREIKAGRIGSVLVTKLDRITRSISDLLNLIDFFKGHNVQFVSITENLDTSTAMGRFMQHLLGLIAQLEREVAAERVATDMRHRATQGKWNGGIVPYGYTTQGLLINKYKSRGMEHGVALSEALKLCPEPKKLYIDPEESTVVKWIYETFLEINSVRKTSTRLNSRGIKTRRGALWAQSTIHRILRSPIYTGKICYGKRKTDPGTGKLVNQDKDTWTTVDGDHDAIISNRVFANAQDMLGQNERKPAKQGRSYLLSGILKCGLCSGPLSGHTFTKKESGKTYSYYKCVNRLQKGTVACKGQSLPAKNLEDFVIQQLMQLSNNQVFLADKKKMFEILTAKVNHSDFEIDVQRIDKEIEGLRKRLEMLLDKLEMGLIADDDFQPRYQRIKTDIAVLEKEKARIRGLLGSGQAAIDNLKTSFEEIASFSRNWEFLDDVGKSMRVRSIVKEIRATKDRIDMDIYLDVANLSHMDKDSWQQPA